MSRLASWNVSLRKPVEDTTISPEQRSVTLGGRSFNVIDFDRRTVMIDHYLVKHVRASGVDKVMPMDGEGNEEFLIRMQTLLVDSQRLPELLGGLLLPNGIPESEWTPSIAAATTKHIKNCNTQFDRELVMQLGMDLSIKFFKQGLGWLARSLNSLREMQQSPESVTSLPH